MLPGMGENIISIRPMADIWMTNGAAAERRGALEDAATAYRRVIETNPAHDGALHGLGRVYAALGRWAESEAAYLKLLEADNNDLGIWTGLAEAYGAQGKGQHHRFALGWILMLDPGSGWARYDLALALEAAGESWKAKRHLLKYLELRPDGPDADDARRRLLGVG